MPLRNWILGLFGLSEQRKADAQHHRGPATHVIILDGTASSLKPGCETNVGLTYRLLKEVGQSANLSIYYEAGIQWRSWRETWDVMTGRGINRQIRRAYGVLASRYRAGDTIMLIGFSRGAYAVRSLAGVIDMVGLLRPENATVTHIRTAYRHYESGATSQSAQAFKALCHDAAQIEAVAVWDTVKALGLRFPVLWRLSMNKHAFHNSSLGDSVKNGFHALAIDETRVAYEPVMWTCPNDWYGHMQQVWFKGTHGDVGGQRGDHMAGRPLSNIPLVWMLERLERCGLPLPVEWKSRFPQDANAPSLGQWHGWSKLFWLRQKRTVGNDRSESIHASVD